MAWNWTTPKLWGAGEILTSDDMNTYVSTNMISLLNRPSCKGVKTATSSIAHDTWTSISLLTGLWDTDSMHDPAGANPSRIYVPASLSGRWRYDIITRWNQKNDVGGRRAMRFLVNGTTGSETLMSVPPVPVGNLVTSATTALALNGGDYVEAQVYQYDTAAATNTLMSIEVIATFDGFIS